MPPTAAPALYAELVKIALRAEWSRRDRVVALADLLARLFLEATKKENLAFSTLFARISYAGHRFNFQPETLRGIHFFRKIAERARHAEAPESVKEKDLTLGIQAVAETVLVLTGSAFPPEIIDLLQVGERYEFQSPEIWDYKARARVVAVSDDADNFCLVCLDEESPERPVRVRYGIPERNENFTRSIQSIRKTFGFPLTLNLLDVDIDRHGEYRPRAFVIEPDFLFDVSAISECFRDTGAEPLTYLAKKFLPFESSPQLLLGNIANHFLDRLMTEPGAEWRALLLETFQLYPFVFAPMSDAEVKDIADKSQKHFTTIRAMTVGGGFSKEGIDPADCFLEPTFFSETYGIQGRLDLFYKTETKAAIVELKGGSVYKPNSYGISRSHFTQTLLYDLLVRSVFGKLLDPAMYILYSGQEINQLRFAPRVHAEQMEALQVRNQLIAIERRLANIRPGEETVPMLLQLRGSVDGGKGFTARDFGLFENTYRQLSTLERKYFNAFAGFIAREQILAKTGEEDAETVNGNASLWRSPFRQKQNEFSILSHLEIIENQAHAPDPFILFQKTEGTNPLANFRVGDIAVLYPAEADTDCVLHSQVIKCTIVELGKQHVRVVLRYRQFNLNPFDTVEGGYWNLEPDMMEIGFGNMHRSLFEWATVSAPKRAMLLALEPPRISDLGFGISDLPKVEADVEIRNPTSETRNQLTDEQAAIFQKIIHSQDYFLLWGPPGTGKTSVMLRALAEHWLLKTEENILLLAYTNRAVDEICDALDRIETGKNADGEDVRSLYLRIGSRFSTAERFRGQLLNAKISGAKKRSELREILERHRIFVGTVASFAQNDGVLRLKKFQRLVVDEASQLLEPQLVGLLSRFAHFTLIGDHKQLPAITVQRAELSRVPDEEADLRSIGLTDLRVSYFERLYRRCETQGWDWAFARLSRQGRMHADIMDFPNGHFYGGFLQTLGLAGAADFQNEALAYGQNLEKVPSENPGVFSGPNFSSRFDFSVLQNRRVVFLPTPAETALPGQKTNAAEAELIADIVLYFKELWLKNGLAWKPSTLGIITPWRAQIAQIRQSLAGREMDPDELTIDTVERYQGGARDVILISCCANHPAQLASLVSLSDEGVDRKLNVALTRARRHVVVVGNAQVLGMDVRYRAFLERYGVGGG